MKRLIFFFLGASIVFGANLASCAPVSTMAPSPTPQPPSETPTAAPTRTFTPAPIGTPTPAAPALPDLIQTYVDAHPDPAAAGYTLNTDPDGTAHLIFAPETQLSKEELVPLINKECAAARACVGFADGGDIFFHGVWSGDFEVVINADGQLQVFAEAFTNHNGLEKVRMLILYDWPKNVINDKLGIPQNPNVTDLKAVFVHGKPMKAIFKDTKATSTLAQKYFVPLGYGDDYIRQVIKWVNGQLKLEDLKPPLFFVIG